VIMIDFSDSKDVQMVLETLQSFVKRKVPVRFGLVPTIKYQGAAAQAKIVYHLLNNYGLNALFDYLEKV
jgi:UDP-glucose:glycoprotein glucosyltransferase